MAYWISIQLIWYFLAHNYEYWLYNFIFGHLPTAYQRQFCYYRSVLLANATHYSMSIYMILQEIFTAFIYTDTVGNENINKSQ